MIERVVENWLDSVNERGYEIAFCQVLIAEGHTIIRRPAHGPTEHGKDIVSRDRQGNFHAYQLKTGDLNKSQWRQIRGEVEELINVPLQEPGVSPKTRFTPYLVTNGELKEPVKDEVRARSEGTGGHGYRRLGFITRDNLLRRFLDVHANFFPFAPADFERFLRLYLADKRSFLRKEEFGEFLSSLLATGSEMEGIQVRRAMAAVAVLANYILSGYQKAGNHLAAAEGWMLVFAHVLRIAEGARPSDSTWRGVVEICIDGWEVATGALVKEAMASRNWIEGDASVDNFVHGHRKTLLIGYLATFALYKRLTNRELPNEDEIFARVSTELRPLRFWGESAVPFFIAVFLFLLKRGSEGEAVQLCANLIQIIATMNGFGQGPGLPDPYLDSGDILERELSAKRALEVMQFVMLRDRSTNVIGTEEYYKALVGLAQNATGRPAWDVGQTFAGRSFGIRCLVEFLARRERKQTLKRLWYEIARVDYSEFVPARASDFYLWHAKRGTLVTRRFKRPESWSNLTRQANSCTRRRILLFEQFPQLLIPFALVYPHRLTPDCVLRWEKMLEGISYPA